MIIPLTCRRTIYVTAFLNFRLYDLQIGHGCIKINQMISRFATLCVVVYKDGKLNVQYNLIQLPKTAKVDTLVVGFETRLKTAICNACTINRVSQAKST